MTDRKATKTAARVIALSLLLTGILYALTGCGPIEVRSAPPGSDLDGVAIEGDRLILRLLVINRNDIPLIVDGTTLEVTIAGETLEARDWSIALQLGPRNREAIELPLIASEFILDELAALERGERGPLAYELDGQWSLDGSRDGLIQRSGFLHPVPGRPGRFR